MREERQEGENERSKWTYWDGLVMDRRKGKRKRSENEEIMRRDEK